MDDSNNTFFIPYEFMNELYQWSDETFGIDVSPVGALHHLKDEADEALENPGDILEFADMQILLFDALRKAGHTPMELETALYDKFEILKTRTYGQPDERGVRHHVRA